MTQSLESAFEKLSSWCRNENYSGYDPFDGLNSTLFQHTPLKHSRTARLAWLQLFKRSPLNLRAIAGVRKGQNPKALALFALAYISRYRLGGHDADGAEAKKLLAELLDLKATGVSGFGWGYNFDWQNRAFFAPMGTPAIVPTAFVARAMVEAAAAFGEKSYLETASGACDFIGSNLAVVEETDDEVCWSYTPTDRTRVYNASLLAAEVYATVGAVLGNDQWMHLGIRGARFVVRRQRKDGSWSYGADSFQSWADNFHTAFILTSLSRIVRSCGSDVRDEFESALRLGYDFWVKNFFNDDGWPKYYPDQLYPADAHSSGAALVAFAELEWLDAKAKIHAMLIANWAIENLLNSEGFFSYQRRRFHTVRIPYMRWSQAWMLYGLGRLLETTKV